MKIVALGTSNFMVSCIRGLNDSGCFIQEVITLPKHLLPDNSSDLKDFAAGINAGYFETENINSESSKEHIRCLSPDFIFSAWPKIIDSELLKIPTYGVIGTHPTALPFNRGRHPLQWQIVLGLRESKLSFLWLDSGIDSGSIILQFPYNIEPEDTILTLTDRLNTLAYSSSCKLAEMLNSNELPKGYPQDSSLSNTWRKRDRYDVLIDFRMNGDDILALIRSFVAPYPCASFIFENHYFNVLSGDKVRPESHVPLQYFEPGYVIKADGCTLYIKTASEVLKIRSKQNVENILAKVKYIHPPGKYLAKHPEMAALFFQK
jgi:methionyl-tRNA formyltransferase